MKQLGVKDASKKLGSTSSFAEYKKKNFDISETKNYETNVVTNNKNVMNLVNKDKKYAEKRKTIIEQIANNPSFNKKETKDKETKKKETGDAKKQKIREEMLAKIKKTRLSKQIGNEKK